MRFSINQVTYGEREFRTVVEATAAASFDAIELWLPHVEAHLADGHSAEEARTLLDDHGVEAVGACAVDGLLKAAGRDKRRAFDVAKARFELCQVLGAGAIACVADGPASPTRDDYSDAVERAREIGDLAASFGLTVAFEFIAGFPFVGTLATAARLVEEADHPNVGVLFDSFHFSTGASKLADFECLDNRGIAFVHLSDTPDEPREVLTDADRVLPGQGCLPLDEIIEHIDQTGYDGCYSIELFNRELWATDPFEVARLAYQACECLGS